MPAEISFELARFEWVTPDRLEVEGTWHGVRRRLARATLVVEVDGQRRHLRALLEDSGDPDRWTAAFAWKGDDMPKLPGAELEVGRSIVVDLPRPRRSKARDAAELQSQPPIPATTRAEKDAGPGPEDTEIQTLRARAEAAEAELSTFRARAEEADAELTTVRSTAEREAASLRARAEEAEAEITALRVKAQEAASLRARAEEAEAALDSRRAKVEERKAAVAPDVARLRTELESVERERSELRAQLDSTAERLERATRSAVTAGHTQPMPPPTTTAGGATRFRGAAPPSEDSDAMDPRARRRAARRFDRAVPADAPAGEPSRRGRRPAERTAARRAPEPPARERPPLAERLAGWVGSVVGSRDDDAEESKNGESVAATRLRAKTTKAAPDATAEAPQAPAARPAQAAARTRSRSAPRPVPAERREQRSWALRLIAIGLLALVLITLLLIVVSIA